MFKLYIIIIFLVISAAFSNSVMDTLQFRYNKSIFASDSFNQEFFNPKISWKNKWKDGDSKKGEKFLGSSTVFVMFADAWHLAQFFMFTFFELIFITMYYFWKKPRWYISFFQLVLLKVIFGVIFELSFTKILIIS